MGSRLLTAVVLGGVIGWEREIRGRAAGLRTHMLVALGSALFTLVPLESGSQDLANIVKGVAAGIGFLGAGAILKLTAEREIKGLTTAGSIWLTAAMGVACGAGKMWIALASIVLSIVILAVVARAAPANDQDTSEHSKPQ
jgi:putative Mg2+ transporter-C (MgtC) family protein